MQAVETFECTLHDSTSTGRVEFFYKYSGLSAIRIPRELLPGCSSFPVLQNPGVYFLFGPVDPDDEDSPMAVYVGQSEAVWERLMCHFRSSSKTFFTHAIALTKPARQWHGTDLDYLESKAFQMVKEAGRFNVRTKAVPRNRILDVSSKESLDRDLAIAKQVLSLLGNEMTLSSDERQNDERETRLKFTLSGKSGFLATGQWVSDGFVVLKGSTISQTIAPSAQTWIRRRRKKYASLVDSKRRLKESIKFSSPSAAATFVTGCPTDGWFAWKCNRKTLREMEADSDRSIQQKNGKPSGMSSVSSLGTNVS